MGVLTTKIRVTASAVATVTEGGAANTATDTLSVQTTRKETDTPANDRGFSIEKTLASGTDTYTLDDGSINDLLGDALTFASITSIIVKNAGSANTVTLGGTLDSSGISAKCGPGGCIIIDYAAAVAVGSGETLTITATGGSVDYELIVVGND